MEKSVDVSRPAESGSWLPPDVYRSFLAITDALGRRRFSKVDYLAGKYARRFPAYAGYYQEQEALAHRLRGHKKQCLELFRKADAFFEGKSLPTARYLIRELRRQKHFAEARRVLRRTLASFPDDPGLVLEGVKLLFEEGHVRDALRVLRQVCEGDASYSFWLLRAQYAFELGLYEESEKAFQACRERFPDADTPWCNAIFFAHYMPDRTPEAIQDLIVRWHAAICAPLPPTDPDALRRPTNPDKRLRIGIVAAGLTTHPVGWMSARALQLLSKLPGYELFFYSVPEQEDIRGFLYRMFRGTASKWTDARGWNYERLYRRLLDDRLDLVIDMCGHGEGSMLPVLARRVAPVQIKWVGGLIDTTGVPAMDYLLSDRHETPNGCDGAYAENIVRLPHSYIAYTPPNYGVETDPVIRPAESPICFGCFNNAHKLNPVIVGVWADILRRVPGSTVFVKSFSLDKQDIREHVTDMFAAQGIELSRIRCEGRSPQPELLACYDDVDIALDPWPYSGGLTTLEAVWKGVPVITRPGPTFAGRHAASHLCNMGLHDLVVDSFEAYADLAVTLAENRALRERLRYLLPYSLLTSPLVRHDQLAADLDTAFRAMWKRHCEGLPPVAMRFEQPSPIPKELEEFAAKFENMSDAPRQQCPGERL